MKILQLNFEKGWRGGERQTLYCMMAFRDAGHQVELLARAGGPLAQRAAEQGFTVHAVRHVPGQIGFLASRGRRYDIIHAQTANTVTWDVLTNPLHGRPLRLQEPRLSKNPESHYRWPEVITSGRSASVH